MEHQAAVTVITAMSIVLFVALYYIIASLIVSDARRNQGYADNIDKVLSVFMGFAGSFIFTGITLALAMQVLERTNAAIAIPFAALVMAVITSRLFNGGGG
jgi:hypothetical protein